MADRGKTSKKKRQTAEPQPGALAAAPPLLTILPDHAIPGEDPLLDSLELEKRLGPVLDIIRHPNTRPPLAVAIYGDWGSGKSSAMRWIQGTLTESNKHVTKKDRVIVRSVWFEPWKYHTREDVWRGLIAEVIIHCINAQNLDASNASRRLTSAARQFGQFLGRSFLHTLSNVALKVGVSGAEAELRGEAFRDIYEEWRQTSHPEKGFLNDFEETLASWIRDSVPPDTERMVIFIDDLDRCLPEVALQVLEALKLYLSIDNLIFVVGVDRTVVESLVTRHYRRHGVIEQKSIRYLEKMFQVEATVEPSERQIDGFFTAQVQAVNDATGDYWDRMLPDEEEDDEEYEHTHRTVIHRVIRNLCYHNPRQIKRLLNNVLMEAGAASASKRNAGEEAERLAFAQGAQVCLLRHVLDSLHQRTGGSLRLEAEQRFFEAFSEFVRKYPDLSPKDVPEEPPDDEEELRRPRAAAQRSRKPDRVGGKTSNQALKALMHKIPTSLDDDWVRAVLKDSDIWDLMRIPFSREVASLAPSVGARPASAASAARLPDFLASIIASQLRKPVDALTSDDLGKIKELDLSEAMSVTDMGLANLQHLPSLQKLRLDGTGVTDAGLANLQGLTSLRDLSLTNTRMTDAGLAYLHSLTFLRDLSLSITEVTDAGLAHLESFASLQSLWLAHTRVTNAGLVHLQCLTSLRTLWLDNTGVTDAGLVHLKSHTSLRELSLANTRVTDAGLAHLKSLTSLRWLWLDDTGVSDSGLAYLKNLASLQWLSLDGTGATDAGLVYLKSLASLQDLSLDRTGVTDAGLVHLKSLTSLQELSLSRTSVTDSGLAHLQSLASLRELSLDLTGVTDAGLAHLQGLTSLRMISLYNTGVTVAGVRDLKQARPDLFVIR